MNIVIKKSLSRRTVLRGFAASDRRPLRVGGRRFLRLCSGTKIPGRGPMKNMMFTALLLAPVMVFGAQAQNTASAGLASAREIAPKMPAPVAPFEWA